ncbi:P-type conjugative transfer protein TrbG [Caulobacter sp. UNC279MFTsu5.1]|uniref:P-type conjugative transfer protein TrbG n=1 Tax=Caulobacter sp. UNC279MFTsu5.1 TaxID=1502775 RepID=UPI0008E26BC7|nr:P-type conjugative transfer protein TrbG [Caulobacter sp. UNC279MFTsu5.1]SFI59817.1 type IV secretion system protein VirB9 [Caulobacter sp. UNC279MFTsu5.1]
MSRPFLIAALVGLMAPAAGQAWPSARRAEPPQALAAVEFLFSEGGVYDLVAAPGHVTDIVLEPGEALVETNPIAAGDTVRWVIGDTASGEGETRRVHVLVKPVQPDLTSNLIINTSRRSYHLRMRASARAYLSQVAWRYPPAAMSKAAAEPVVVLAPPVATAPVRLNFDYRLKGRARWRPARVFDDGARTYVEFGPGAALTDLPPLYVLGADGKTAELVNYRVDGRRLVVDRLFDHAELRFGLKRWERRVRIERGVGDQEAGR